ALMQQPHFDEGPGRALAVALALTAALTSAIAMLGLNRLKGLDPLAIVAHFSGVATCVVLGACLVGAFLLGRPIARHHVEDPTNLALLLGVGVTATLGQFCLTRAFTAGQPARVSVVCLAQIVFALGLDLAFGGP